MFKSILFHAHTKKKYRIIFTLLLESQDWCSEPLYGLPVCSIFIQKWQMPHSKLQRRLNCCSDASHLWSGNIHVVFLFPICMHLYFCLLNPKASLRSLPVLMRAYRTLLVLNGFK